MDQKHVREILPFAGLLPALAIATNLAAALAMSAAVVPVLLASMILASLVRARIPDAIRDLVLFTIIASMVTIADQIMMAHAFEMHGELSIYVGLIATSCIVFGRVETFSLHETPFASARAGLWHGLVFSAMLCFVGAIREIVGMGTILGHPLLPLRSEFGGLLPNDLALLAPGALFLAGGLCWAGRSLQIALATGRHDARAFGAGR